MILREGLHPILLNKIRSDNFLQEKAESSLIESRTSYNNKEYFPRTNLPLALMFRLFNPPGRQSITCFSARERGAEDDLIDLWHSTSSPNSLGLYCRLSGATTFALRDISNGKRNLYGNAPKIISSGIELNDARLTAQFLIEFAKSLRSSVEINGPTEDEPFVVLTFSDGRTIGKFEENGNIKEIIGIIFRQIIYKNDKTVHGKVELLVREK